jgi:hypothetical protein
LNVVEQKPPSDERFQTRFVMVPGLLRLGLSK